MDTQTQPTTSGSTNVILQWTAPVNPIVHRTKLWYICAGVFVALTIAFAVWTAAWSFLTIFILTAGGYWVMHRTDPIERTMVVGKEGFFYGKTFVRWNECTGFWMLQGHGYIELHVERAKRFSDNIVIQTGPYNAEQIRTVFGAFLPEEQGRTERILDTFIRICKL